MSEFPTALHADTIRLLDWRQQDRAEGRPRTLKKLQPLAAHHLELIISHIYGYSKTVLGLPEVNSLKELLRKDLVENYVRWNRKRRIDGDSFRKKMNFLYASIKHFPQFADQDLGWFPAACELMPDTTEAKKSTRREDKGIRFAKLQSLVTKLSKTLK